VVGSLASYPWKNTLVGTFTGSAVNSDVAVYRNGAVLIKACS